MTAFIVQDAINKAVSIYIQSDIISIDYIQSDIIAVTTAGGDHPNRTSDTALYNLIS